jgi:hypothetical protein
MTNGTIWGWVCVALLGTAACAGSKAQVDQPTSGVDAGAASSPSASAQDAGPPLKPFANTALEAQSMIQSQIDTRMKLLWKCVDAWRSKQPDPHKAFAVDIGIDQEGTLLGVTTTNLKQGELEPSLRDCLMAGLRGLNFPRSHSGVITVRQTFQDSTIQQ